MNLGKNLQFLRAMMNKMTQEELAERMGVSRQTVSKWELDSATPELDKLIELSALFNISLDELVQGELNTNDEHYSNIRIETLEPFSYARYAVLSIEPEEDAIDHVRKWAAGQGDSDPKIIGWDLPILSQEQINVFHMHGYCAAWVIPEGLEVKELPAEILYQDRAKYAVITIKFPFEAPFRIIPNAYKTLMSFMKVNGIKGRFGDGIIDCFEHSYYVDGVEYMDVYIAVE